MKILLIHPKLEGSFYEDVKLPPMGIAYIAGALRDVNYKVKILDATLSKDQMFDIRNIVTEYSPDIVGISSPTPLIQISLKISNLIKGINKDIKIIFGGVHPTLFPKDVAKEANVDYVVHGEGEETIVELVKNIEKSKEPKGVLGIAYKKNGKVVVNAPRSLIRDLDSIPFPAYDLLPINEYYSPQISKTPFTSMITSRGCPYQCIYCDVHVVFGRNYRFNSPERTLREIQYLINKFKVKEIMFKDSEFTLNQDRIEKLCDLIIKEKIKIRWSCNGRVGRVTLPMLKKMRKSGCRLTQYGVESGDQRVLDTLKKQITIQQVKETFRISRKAGLKTVANFMIGNPGESKESIEKTIRLVKEIKADYGNFGFIIPFPGTELYNLASQNGWLLENFDPLNIKIDDCVMNATSMSTPELKQMRKKVFRSFYLRPSYVIRRVFTSNLHEWKMNFKGLFKILKL